MSASVDLQTVHPRKLAAVRREVAVAVHRGPYHRMNEAHDAIRM